MLKNLTRESANNPGTGTSISLLGTSTGYVTFISQFGSGAEAMYYITNGTVTELNTGIVTAGSPNLLARGTPLWVSNQTGPTYTRANFTGAITIYSALGADQTLYSDRNNLFQARARRITNLALATGATDAVAWGNLGWNVISESISASSQATVDFNVPAGAIRLRFEFSDCSPATAAGEFYLRVNRGSGFLSGASDYIFAYNGGNGASSPYVPLCGGNVSESVFGFLEMQTTTKCYGVGPITTSLSTIFVNGLTSFSTASTGAAITQVRFGFDTPATAVAGHRIRMLVQRI